MALYDTIKKVTLESINNAKLQPKQLSFRTEYKDKKTGDMVPLKTPKMSLESKGDYIPERIGTVAIGGTTYSVMVKYVVTLVDDGGEGSESSSSSLL